MNGNASSEDQARLQRAVETLTINTDPSAVEDIESVYDVRPSVIYTVARLRFNVYGAY